MNKAELTKLNVGYNLDWLMNLDPRGYGVCRILYDGASKYTGKPLSLNGAEGLVKNIKKSCPARIFLLRKTAIIRCFLYICKIWVMRDTVCHCHPCDAYESLSEQTENNAFTCHP